MLYIVPLLYCSPEVDGVLPPVTLTPLMTLLTYSPPIHTSNLSSGIILLCQSDEVRSAHLSTYSDEEQERTFLT